MDELSIKREVHQATKELMARDEFLARYCIGWPAVYKASCPFTDSARELLDWKADTENAMAADFAASQKELASPWMKVGPACRHLDWSDVPAAERIEIGYQTEAGLGMPAPVKAGKGVDPFDGNVKPYATFTEVDRAWEASKASPDYAAQQQKEKQDAATQSRQEANGLLTDDASDSENAG